MTTTHQKKAIIIGAGIAGLATAIRLRKLGLDVSVYETNATPGGKLTEMKDQDYRFDCGPSLFTMPQFIEELFSLCGKTYTDYFQYQKTTTVCNYFYEDGTQFTAPDHIQTFAQAAAQQFDVQPQQIIDYFKNSQRKYDLTASLFLERSLHTLSTYLSLDTLRGIANSMRLDIHTTLHKHNTKWFTDPKLVQLFDRYATYNGSSPYATPGIMAMIPHLEQHFGTFFPKGGMYSIAKSLHQLALDIGVQFHFNTAVDRIVVQHKKAVAIESNSKQHKADIIVSNMDVVPTYRRLLKTQKAPEKTLKQPRSSSALIFYWGITQSFPELDLHNIFFTTDYQKEFDCIFNTKGLHDDPTIYINISSKYESSDAPKGCENWFVMINVPNNQQQDWDTIIQMARQHILKKLSRLLNTNIEALIATEKILDPRTIESNTQSYQGALYGAASNNTYAAFLRHPNFSSKIKNLYFCGGSVHPGGGIPLCLLSGKIVSELIAKQI